LQNIKWRTMIKIKNYLLKIFQTDWGAFKVVRLSQLPFLFGFIGDIGHELQKNEPLFNKGI